MERDGTGTGNDSRHHYASANRMSACGIINGLACGNTAAKCTFLLHAGKENEDRNRGECGGVIGGGNRDVIGVCWGLRSMRETACYI